jgi:hypothetical protein
VKCEPEAWEEVNRSYIEDEVRKTSE